MTDFPAEPSHGKDEFTPSATGPVGWGGGGASVPDAPEPAPTPAAETTSAGVAPNAATAPGVAGWGQAPWSPGTPAPGYGYPAAYPYPVGYPSYPAGYPSTPLQPYGFPGGYAYPSAGYGPYGHVGYGGYPAPGYGYGYPPYAYGYAVPGTPGWRPRVPLPIPARAGIVAAGASIVATLTPWSSSLYSDSTLGYTTSTTRFGVTTGIGAIVALAAIAALILSANSRRPERRRGFAVTNIVIGLVCVIACGLSLAYPDTSSSGYFTFGHLQSTNLGWGVFLALLAAAAVAATALWQFLEARGAPPSTSAATAPPSTAQMS